VASLRWIRQLACRAYWTATLGRPGPVHLNLPLREPLVLDEPLGDDPLPGRADGAPWVQLYRRPGIAVDDAERPAPGRGVVVAGRIERSGAGGRSSVEVADAARRLAARAGWPLLADPLSGARQAENAIATYDLLLRDPRFAAGVTPDLVVRVGDLPTSKPLRAWLESLGPVPQLTIDPDQAWQDPAAVVAQLDVGDPVAALDRIASAGGGDPGWLAEWRAADEAASAALTESLGEELSEPLVAARIGDWLSPTVTLFVAASMPIRDLELYLPAGRPLPRILSNRGANGIDGTVSTAFGVAAASTGPVVVLIGDVALAHDLGGLLAAGRLGLDLTIVLLNNDGGGIFHFLPISGEGDAFELHIATPHGLRFADAARLYGLRHVQPGTVPELHDAVARSVGTGGSSLIEVRTDRPANLTLHRRLADAGLRAVGNRPEVSA
jgi:2-succinyl-5-enolpyruvyl-6-hydroxy-3-cyclohexene-1-carboxylate synthase